MPDTLLPEGALATSAPFQQRIRQATVSYAASFLATFQGKLTPTPKERLQAKFLQGLLLGRLDMHLEMICRIIATKSQVSAKIIVPSNGDLANVALDPTVTDAQLALPVVLPAAVDMLALTVPDA